MKVFYCLGLWYLLIAASVTHAKEQMNWSVINWPPLMILQGENTGEGRYDLFLDLLQQQMPQYQHSKIEMNWNRVWTDIKAGKKVCNIMSLKNNKRTQFALFSNPSSVTLSNRIILKASTYELLGKPASLSISELANHSKLSGAIESSRSYTQALDKLIDERSEHSKLKHYVTNSVQLMKMLTVGRFDYLIEYPFIASYLLKGMDKPNTKIISVPIQEIAPYSVSYLACPKTPWGEERIRVYNEVLDKLAVTDEYLQVMQTWYATDEERSAVLKGFNEVRKQ